MIRGVLFAISFVFSLNSFASDRVLGDLNWYENQISQVGRLEKEISIGHAYIRYPTGNKERNKNIKHIKEILLAVSIASNQDYQYFSAYPQSPTGDAILAKLKQMNEWAIEYAYIPVGSGPYIGFREVASQSRDAVGGITALPSYPFVFGICWDTGWRGCQEGARLHRARYVAAGVFFYPLYAVGAAVGYVLSPFVFAGRKIFEAIRSVRDQRTIHAPRKARRYAIDPELADARN